MPCFNFGSCLVYNKAQEGIAKTDRLGFDVYNGIADVKSLWLKYCKQFEPRLRLLVPNFRVTPVVEEETKKRSLFSSILDTWNDFGFPLSSWSIHDTWNDFPHHLDRSLTHGTIALITLVDP